MHELVAVTWTDAVFSLDEPEIRDAFLVTTVGYLLSSGPRFVRVAGEQTPDGFRAVTDIPVEVVRDTRTLEAVTRERF